MDDQPDQEADELKESTVKRIATFLRSVIPLDPTQLLFLTGAILLLVAPRVSWRPIAPIRGGTLNYWEVYSYTVAGNIVVLAAGLTALYACFWPSRNPVRRVFWGVLVTGFLALLFLFWKFIDLAVGERSVLDTHSRMSEMFPWVKLNILNFPTGFFILALGLGFVVIYFSRMFLQVGSLPLTLSNDDRCARAGNVAPRQAGSLCTYRSLWFSCQCFLSACDAGVETTVGACQ